MRTILSVLITGFMFVCSAERIFASGEDGFRDVWEVGFTFGEIPFLSGSFKPGLTFGYHFNRNFSLSTSIQLKDYLQRDEESFNATNLGFEGLISSHEMTGERILFAVQYRPAVWSPYLIAGFVFNNEDIEIMKFDRQERQIGATLYDTELTIIQTRKSGFVPAVGFGYRYDFDNGISINTNIAAGVFSGIPDPDVKIESSGAISSEDSSMLDEKMDAAYKNNFHNHYHIFNLGVIYRFK